MLSQPPAWFMLLAFLGAIGPLIIFHELGHYWVARWFGVGAEAFSIGFGKEIFGWTDKRGTRWRIGALPLGGYVKFIGDAGATSAPATTPDVPADRRSQSFHLRPPWQRFLIVLAGPMTNFIIAIVILSASSRRSESPRRRPWCNSWWPAARPSGQASGPAIESSRLPVDRPRASRNCRAS